MTTPTDDEGLREELRQVVDDGVLKHTGRSVGDIASAAVADDLMALISQKVTECERRAYKQGWDSAGGEMIGVKQDISEQITEARIDEFNLVNQLFNVPGCGITPKSAGEEVKRRLIARKNELQASLNTEQDTKENE